ncbi:hypothetical protein Dsin_025179 [Dipteronia sinensis]|uniref:DUF4216 domain-containing protein n=1 Tax=Dipteronia sinensis TaxID=43782 RepID=A0AAD9ZVM5_9ROSI|nr:hypothetical protein Dsin_025179 [Dipteronia sinensis]
MKRKFIRLALLISGPNQPGNDIDVYLAPLIDDLKTLWEVGVEAYDAYKQKKFTLRALLLWTINDYPAYGNLSGCVVKGKYACPICGERTYNCRLKHEAIEFCIEYYCDMSAIGNPIEKDNVQVGNPLPSGRAVVVEIQELQQAHHYVLQNTIKVQSYIELAHGPRHLVIKGSGYDINNYRYHIYDRDNALVSQNSKVTIVATAMQIASAKDKNSVFGEMSFYGVIKEIWELDYHMFKIPVFKCDWVESNGGIKVDDLGYTLVDLNRVVMEPIDTPTSPKKARGMARLVINRANENKIVVPFDECGVPAGEEGQKLSTAIGILARTTIPLTYTDWRKVSDHVKEIMWECIIAIFEVDLRAKKKIIFSIGEKFQTFRNTLTTKYIIPFMNRPEALENPPLVYNFIQKSDWDSFVAIRRSEQFRVLHILTQAFGSKEHTGRVRGVGKFVTPTSYFHTPNLRADWVRDKKEWEKQKMGYDRRLADLEAKLLGRANDQQSPAAHFESHSSNFTPTMFSEGQMKGSHTITTKIKVEHTLCKSARDTIDNIVANGTILEHNVAEVLVSIDVILNEDALLPIPSEDYELFYVKDALGHHINWPSELVVEDSVIAVRKKVDETEKVKRPSKFSLGIENFVKKAWRVIAPGDVIRVNFDEGIFSLEYYCFFGMEEVTTMINMKELQQTSICLYMRHLYNNKIKGRSMVDTFGFFNPTEVFLAGGFNDTRRES